MFEFGRDLRRLFEKARDSHDLGWLELVGLNLVEAEARTQAIDAGRVSCARPYEGWMRAAALWREHARRSGSSESLQRAEQAGRDAGRSALNEDQAVRATLDVGHTAMLAFDLFGVPRRLDGLLDSLASLSAVRRPDTQAEIDALRARLNARKARIAGDAKLIAEAAQKLADAMQAFKPDDTAIGEDLQLDRAALSLEAGLLTRNARLLDQAGRELRALVESAAPDERPVSRARALALCGTGMAALAAVADDPSARQQARALFDAAADQFTPEHSPLDWATIQLLKAERSEGDPAALDQAQKLTDKPGLMIGAMIRERVLAHTLIEADTKGDFTAMTKVEILLRHRLTRPMDETTAIDWASDQISMARLAMSLSTRLGYPMKDLGMALYEAADAATLAGAPSLAARAKDLMVLAKTY